MVQHILVQSPVISSQITALSIVYLAVHWVTDQRKHQSSRSLAFVRGIHRWPLDSPHKGPVTRKMFHLMTPSWYGSLTNIQVWDGIGIYAIRMRQLVFPMKWHLQLSHMDKTSWYVYIPLDIHYGAIITRSVFSQIPTIETPLLAREGEIWRVVCSLNSDLYSPSGSAVLDEISYYIGHHYNGTRLCFTPEREDWYVSHSICTVNL